MQTTFGYMNMEEYGSQHVTGDRDIDIGELEGLDGFGSKLKKGLKKVGRAVDKSRRKIDDVVFKNKLAQKVGVAKLREETERVAHNPAVQRVVGTVVAAVASVVATPAAGAAIMYGVKMATNKIVANQQVRNATQQAEKDDAIFERLQAAIPYMNDEQRVKAKNYYDTSGTRAFGGRNAQRDAVELLNAATAKRLAAINQTQATVVAKMNTLPYEQRVVVQDAYAKRGTAAFAEPQIARIIAPALQAGTVSMVQATGQAEGAPLNWITETTQNIVNAAPVVVREQPKAVTQLGNPPSNAMPVMLGLVGLLASVAF